MCKCKNVDNLKKHIMHEHETIKLQKKMQLTDRSELKTLGTNQVLKKVH